MTSSDPTPGHHDEYKPSVEEFEVWEQEFFRHQPVMSMKHGGIVGCQCMDRVFHAKTEDWGTHLAEVVASLIPTALRTEQSALQATRRSMVRYMAEAVSRAEERDALQQRIDAAGKMLLAIVDGLSYVDGKTDPVAIASTTLDEIKTVRAILAPTESKEPDLPLDPWPFPSIGTARHTTGDPRNFNPRPGYSQNPADYGIEAPHE